MLPGARASRQRHAARRRRRRGSRARALGAPRAVPRRLRDRPNGTAGRVGRVHVRRVPVRKAYWSVVAEATSTRPREASPGFLVALRRKVSIRTTTGARARGRSCASRASSRRGSRSVPAASRRCSDATRRAGSQRPPGPARGGRRVLELPAAPAPRRLRRLPRRRPVEHVLLGGRERRSDPPHPPPLTASDVRPRCGARSRAVERDRSPAMLRHRPGPLALLAASAVFPGAVSSVRLEHRRRERARPLRARRGRRRGRRVRLAGLTAAAFRRRDGQTTLLGTAFSTMTAMLAVHGIATPGRALRPERRRRRRGRPVAPGRRAVLALTALPGLRDRAADGAAARAAGRARGGGPGARRRRALWPDARPAVPACGSRAALVLMTVALALFGMLADRAVRTFALTRRADDLPSPSAACGSRRVGRDPDPHPRVARLLRRPPARDHRHPPAWRPGRAATCAAAARRARSSATSAPRRSSPQRRRTWAPASAP